MTGAEDEGRWQAVMRRDREMDGRFVFAVATTGVYCRPSCPARRPRRQHVSFFESAALAQRAGFRPCLRCNPQLRGDARDELVQEVKGYIDSRPGRRITLRELGEWTGLSPWHLQRTFKAAEGITPAEYARRRR